MSGQWAAPFFFIYRGKAGKTVLGRAHYFISHIVPDLAHVVHTWAADPTFTF